MLDDKLEHDMNFMYNTSQILSNEDLKEEYEQFYTSRGVAEYMSDFFVPRSKKNKIYFLDPGAGSGNLSIAFIKSVLKWKKKPKEVNITLYEIDINMKSTLEGVLKNLEKVCVKSNIKLIWEILYKDFIIDMVKKIDIKQHILFDYIMINPPYKKLGLNTKQNKELTKVGINVPNLYAAFVALATLLLKHKGELVVITPRSFCNGVYFKPFREHLKANISFKNIHLFESRTSVFRDDNVLQEIVIYHCTKEKWDNKKKVQIIHSNDDTFEDLSIQSVKSEQVIYPTDLQYTIRIIKSDEDRLIVRKIESLPCTYDDLGIEISTGPIVDFREKAELLSKDLIKRAIPYIGANHIKQGNIMWPSIDAKYNSIIVNDRNRNKMRVLDNYVLVKRISSKGEEKRIICGVLKPEEYESKVIGFDNKTNYIYGKREFLSKRLARGICIFLSSSIVDMYFRIFSGHTQVNVTDLKNLRYPKKEELIKLGEYEWSVLPEQLEIDSWVEKEVFGKFIKMR